MSRTPSFKSIVWILPLITSSALLGQHVVLTDLSPPTGTLSAERMTMVTINNVSEQSLVGSLRAYLLDLQGNPVAELSSRNFRLESGAQKAYTDIPWRKVVTYGSSAAASTLANQGVLGFGDFLLCHEFITESGQEIGRVCSEKTASLSIDFSLIYPAHKAVIESANPILNWEKVVHLGLNSDDVTYEILLVEVQEGQSAIEALDWNSPLLQRANLQSNSLLYPPDGRKLEIGGEYAWMVRVYQRENEVLVSAPWTFSLSDPDALLIAPRKASYAMPTTANGGRSYTFGPFIHLGFDNNEGIEYLRYRIVDLSDRGRPIEKLPTVPALHSGLNTIDISTEDMGLQHGNVYRVEILTPRKQSYFLHFRFDSKL